MTRTIVATDVPARWSDIWAALRAGEREFLITEGAQVRGVILGHALYRRLLALAEWEERRQRALSLPLTAAESPETWDAGFETLERASRKFAGLSDDELDSLFGPVLDEIRGDGQA